jgi:hypothetical protein
MVNLKDLPMLPAKHTVLRDEDGQYKHVWEREGRYVALLLPDARPGQFTRLMVNDAFHRAESA